ncbi:MAG: glycosyltransferase [Bacteroidia bacterium]|nr:glycosyltransferase [Bacteroidia bacterium]
MSYKATVIISVYNRLDFLKLVLAGFETQSETNFEIIISDDGSNEEFVTGVKELMNQSRLTIQHNWHPDVGFRKNKILNRSAQLAQSPYLIFIDGDCIPHPKFVEKHLTYSQSGVCLCGRRVDLSNRITQMLTPENVKKGILQSKRMIFEMFIDYTKRDLFQFMNGFYTENKYLLQFFNRKPRGLLGSNFSLFKEDLLRVNGFDERYYQPTFGEDSDLEFRLRLIGIQIRPILNIAVQYHCWHPMLPRLEGSKQLYEEVVKNRISYTPYGIVKIKF